MKTLAITILFFSLTSMVFGQGYNTPTPYTQHQSAQKYAYAYIVVKGKFLSKKLKVNVDFGETEEQMKAGKEYSDFLTNKKSYAAILNHMVENHFELVETLDYMDVTDGNGGTSGIVFIMKKRINP